MLSLNPYIAGNPVGGTPNFVGRADVLREVLRVMRQPNQNIIVLYGQRRIGKTSVLLQLAARLPQEGTYYPVYFDLQDKASWTLDRVLTDLARAISYELARQGPPELRTTGPLLSDQDTVRAFQGVWLPAVLSRLPAGHSIVLLFDEFDVLADPKGGQAGADLFPYLRGLMSTDPTRLQFAFVIGRKVEDLESIALSLFKGAPALRVSLLNKADTFELVRLSERNETLRWSEESLEKVWDLTHGHPFLIQQLCSRLWENLYDSDPTGTPTVVPEDVERAIPETLEASRNTLEWLWDGLPPAERVVISALAGAGNRSISQPQLEQLLRESGVRVVIRELQNAPQLLQDWDLIEPSEGGYRFRVELFREWILQHKPLSRVQEELDRIEPLAENLYQAAYGFFRSNQLEDAMPLLRQAIGLNPNHARSRQLLAEIFLLRGEVDQAVQILQLLYDTQPSIARPRLVQALLLKAEDEPDDEKRLPIYQQILLIDPQHPITLQRVADIQQAAYKREVAQRLTELQKVEKDKRYREALDLARKLAEKYPDERDWQPDVDRLERKTKLAEDYQKAIGAFNSGNREAALRGLADVIALEPDFEEATRYLHLVKTGHDPALMMNQLAGEQKAHNRAKTRLEEETLARDEAEKQRNELQIRLESEQNHTASYRRMSWRMTYWAVASSVLALIFFVAWLVRGQALENAELSYLSYTQTAVAQAENNLTQVASITPVLATNTPEETASEMETVFPTETVPLTAITPSITPTLTLTPTPEPTQIPTLDPYAGLVIDETQALQRLGKGQLFAAVTSPDGILAAIASSTGIYVYDALTFEPVWSEVTSSRVKSIAISTEGVLAAGLENGTVLLRNATDGSEFASLVEHADSVNCAAFSQDGTLLATGSADGDLVIWDAQDRAKIKKWKAHSAHEITALAFSFDNITLASGSDDQTVAIWDLTDPVTPQPLESYPTSSPVRSMAWSSERMLAWGLNDGTVEVWDFDPFGTPEALPGHDAPVRGIIWSSDGQLVSASDDGEIIFLNLNARNDSQTLSDEHPLPVLGLMWDANGNLITATKEGLQHWNVNEERADLRLFGFTSPVRGIAYSFDGTKLVSGEEDGTVRLWDVATGGQIRTFTEHTEAITGVAFSPDGLVVAAAALDNKIILWDVNTGERVGAATYGASILSLAFSPIDTNRLAFGTSDANVILWNRSSETYQTLSGHQSPVHSVAFSSDGNYLASGSEGGTVMIWDIGTLRSLNVLNGAKGGHADVVYSVAFSPTDTILASGAEDEKIILWTVSTGEKLAEINNLSTPFVTVDFSAERGLLAAGSPDTTVYVWLVSDLSAPLVQLHAHTAEITSVFFSPDTQILASGSLDGTIVLWNAVILTP